MIKQIALLWVLIQSLGLTINAQHPQTTANRWPVIPKFIKQIDNSTSIVLNGLSKDRRFLKEFPEQNDMVLLNDIQYHTTKDIDGNPMSMKMDVIRFKDTGSRPCVLFITGGGFTIAPKQSHLYERYEIAKAGYVVASVISNRYVIEDAGHGTPEFSDPVVIKIMIEFLKQYLR